MATATRLILLLIVCTLAGCARFAGYERTYSLAAQDELGRQVPATLTVRPTPAPALYYGDKSIKPLHP